MASPSVGSQPLFPTRMHVCGMQGYDGMRDERCPGCEDWANELARRGGYCREEGSAHRARNCFNDICKEKGTCMRELLKPAGFIEQRHPESVKSPMIHAQADGDSGDECQCADCIMSGGVACGNRNPDPDSETAPVNPLAEIHTRKEENRSAWLKMETLTGDESVAAIADKLVNTDRQSTYGHPYDNHKRIADLWNSYIEGRRVGGPLTPQDACVLMILLKVARLENGYHRDSVIDICGYGKCLDMIEAEAKRRDA